MEDNNKENKNQKENRDYFSFLTHLKTILIILIGIIFSLFWFGLGLKIGEKKALLSSQWFQEYQRNFLGPKRRPHGPFRFFDNNLINQYGIFGEVIKNDISNSQIILKDNNNLEKIIKINNETIIVKFREKIDQSQIKEGEKLMIISSTVDNQIVAKFIRVFP